MLTENQKKALQHQHHLTVTANAGSGKTTVLVQRFVEILMHTDARINQLVAITFTDKAASELRRKIAEAIDKKIAETAMSSERVRLLQARDQLASANISTIHAFCARVLREYPVEADVDAGFTLLESVDQQMLERQSLNIAIEQILSGKEKEVSRDEFFRVVRILGRRTVEQYLMRFLRRREQIDGLLQTNGLFSSARTDEEILAMWNDRLESHVARYLDEDGWRTAFHRICDAAQGRDVDDVKNKLRRWSNELSNQEKIQLYKSITEIALTKEGKIAKKFISSEVDAESKRFLAGFHKRITPVLGACLDPELKNTNRGLLNVLRIVLNVYNTALEVYQEKKLEQGKLDFEDLQIKMMRLLSVDEIRRRLSSTYLFVMVDEYQDTNRLQYNILRRLVSNFESGNLFIVGDPKQSIYGFRDAEVEMFEKTKNEMTAFAHARHLPDEHATLAESFRLLIDIVAFVNRVFSATMDPAVLPFDVRYDELVQGRASDSSGRVELLLIRDSAEQTEEGGEDNDALEGNSVEKECMMVARRIADLHRIGYTIHEPKTETPRPFQFKDAAILLRSRTYVRQLEQSLEEFHIPYQVSGGIGFYQTQEVYDFLNYLSFLLDTGNDVVLVGILRSPFFAVSDAELFEISLPRSDKTFFEQAQKFCRSQRASSNLQKAIDTLMEHLQLANRIPISLLIHRILHATGWQGTVAGLPFGPQRIVNIRKLLRFAREFEGRGLTNLYDFVERLETLASEEEREGQAAVDAEGDCVRIMTIHAAKGLEFPAVFIPFAHKKFRQNSSPYDDPELGVAFEITNEGNLDEKITPPLFSLLKDRARQRVEAEERRIFYVACTRSRDMLVISGNLDNLASPSYLKWTIDSLSLDPDMIQTGEVNFPTVVRSLLQEDGIIRSGEIHRTLTVHIELDRDDESIQPHEELQGETRYTGGTLLIDPIEAQSKGEFFSATQIKTYLECPTKYFLKYNLGVPEINAVPYSYNENDEPDDRLLGELEGTITHAALQLLGSNRVDDGSLRERIERLVAAHSTLGESQQQRMIESVVQHVSGFMNSPFGKDVLSSKKVETEFTLTCKFGKDYLTGTIDRLYVDANGNWSLLDYKTDRVDAASLRQRAEVYKPQLLFYSLLVKRAYSQRIVPASLVFLRFPHEPVRFSFSEKDIFDFERRIEQVISLIKADNFVKSESLCATCTFQVEGKCLI